MNLTFRTSTIVWVNSLASMVGALKAFRFLCFLSVLCLFIDHQNTVVAFDRGRPGLHAPGQHAILLDAYETYRSGRDLDRFQSELESRLDERSLRLMVTAKDPTVRHASVLALGLVGSYEANEALGAALADPVPMIRIEARQALWSIWFKADSPENNARLTIIVELNSRGRPERAFDLATELIALSSEFAEAYNQRAIASYQLGHYHASIGDCQRTLELNPYHFGALSGLSQCYLELGDLEKALQTYRKSLAIQPHDDGLRRLIEDLESRLAPREDEGPLTEKDLVQSIIVRGIELGS